MQLRCYLSILGASLIVTACSACTEQYDPRGNRERIANEMAVANKPQMKLTPEGEIPAKPVAQAGAAAPADSDPGLAKFQQFCATCHGPEGRGDAPAAASMNPKPRNFHDAAWQGKVTDEHIAKVIKEGGAAAGLSATMPAWGGALSDDDIQAVVKTIRSFKE